MNEYAVTKTFIKVRTQFEGFHYYPNAGDIDPRITFLNQLHRHMFHVSVKISVSTLDRELEFFLVKWTLNEFIKTTELNNMSCEMIGEKIIYEHLIPKYGHNRFYEVEVSEDNENSGIVEHHPLMYPN